MRTISAILTALFLFAAAAAPGADGYRFHIRVTDGRTGLLANPQFSELHMPAEQLERAAGDRVIVLDHTAGTHWTWLMMSWLREKPDVEHTINTTGSGRPDAEADLGLRPNDDGTVRTRCLRSTCVIRVTAADAKQFTVTMKKGESKDLPLDSDFDVTLGTAR